MAGFQGNFLAANRGVAGIQRLGIARFHYNSLLEIIKQQHIIALFDDNMEGPLE